jgi:16S rRNA (adenine1518-N6/adenine1519-N6)-dimethyltransferase
VSNILVTPKRKFGQNFLVNIGVKQKVFRHVDEILARYPSYKVVEVGPGQGDLTEHLVTTGHQIIAIEIDPEAKDVVQERFSHEPNFTVILADALEEISQNNHQLFEGNTILISNLPYNVGSRLLVDLAIFYPQTPFLVILQNEVARKPLTQSDFTLLGGWINLFWDFSYLFKISPGSFYPAPKVFSALVKGDPLPINKDKTKRQKLLELFKKLNANPNKTLANNLLNIPFTKSQIADFYVETKLDIKTRLSWANYKEMLELVYDFSQTLPKT